MLVAALVDLGRNLRCGDDDVYGRLPTDLHGRHRRAAGIRVLPDVSTAPYQCKHRRSGPRTDHKSDQIEQDHAVDSDGRRPRVSLLSPDRDESVHDHRGDRRRIHRRDDPDGDPDRGHDVSYVSVEGRSGHRISTGRAGG